VILLGGLALPRLASYGAPPTVKIGLVAPFEGLYRATGYEVLFAVKLALQERNGGQGLGGYRVELVALNDFNNPTEATKQARALAADPDIVGVIGHLSSEATRAALPVYREAELAVVIPWSVETELLEGQFPGVVSVAMTAEEAAQQLRAKSREMGFTQLETLTAYSPDEPLPEAAQALELDTDAISAGNVISALQQRDLSLPLFGQVEVGNVQLLQVAGEAANGLVFVSPGPGAEELSPNTTFGEAYQALSGLPPGPRAALAYEATNILLDSIEQAIINEDGLYHPSPSRRAVSRQVGIIRRSGLTGQIEFNAHGQRLKAPVWFYQIVETRYPGILIGP
jgi:branched-chain amino acid transport system substrate-binding protein